MNPRNPEVIKYIVDRLPLVIDKRPENWFFESVNGQWVGIELLRALRDKYKDQITPVDIKNYRRFVNSIFNVFDTESIKYVIKHNKNYKKYYNLL